MMETKEKLVPKLRFPEFDDEWKKSTLKKELKSYKLGGNYSNTEKITDRPLIKMGNLGRGGITLDKIQYIENSEKVEDVDEIKNGDLFFNTRNTLDLVGKVAIWRGELPLAYFNSNLMRLMFSNNFFMNYRLNSYQGLKSLKRYATGTTSVAAIYTRDLVKVTVPNLDEQQKIASFLSAVDQKINQLQRKKELLQAYKKGMMQQLFSQQLRFNPAQSGVEGDENGNDFPEWEEYRLKDILIDYKLGGNYKNSESITEKPLIKMGNLGRGNISLDKVQYITDGEEIDNNDLIEYGDLFFNTRNTLELVGKVAIWKNELPIAYYNSNLMRLKFENNFFMNYRLNSYEGIKGLKKYATGTTSVAAIYTRDLLKLKLNLPCLEEQSKIASFLSALDAKIDTVSTAITQTQDFKKGLLQQMFV